jgi:hypothetical protein
VCRGAYRTFHTYLQRNGLLRRGLSCLQHQNLPVSRSIEQAHSSRTLEVLLADTAHLILPHIQRTLRASILALPARLLPQLLLQCILAIVDNKSSHAPPAADAFCSRMTLAWSLECRLVYNAREATQCTNIFSRSMGTQHTPLHEQAPK